MIKKAPVCEDIAFNCSDLIERYTSKGNLDSAMIFLNYWKENYRGLWNICFGKTGYLALQAKYNLVNFDNTGVPNLKDNNFTINFVWGGFFNVYKQNRLKSLEYKYESIVRKANL